MTQDKKSEGSPWNAGVSPPTRVAEDADETPPLRDISKEIALGEESMDRYNETFRDLAR